MNLDLPESLIEKSMLTQREARLCLAVQLYSDRRLTFMDACELAAVLPNVFKKELISRDLSVVVYPELKLTDN